MTATGTATGGASPVSITVLGSGGPMHGGGRGCSAYLLRADTHPVLAVDMGGDTPTKLAKAGVDAGSIPVLAISHLHPDHVSGIPDYIWGEIQAGRKDRLTVIGPPASSDYPSVDQHFVKLFGADGAFSALSGVMVGQYFPVTFITATRDDAIVYRDVSMAVSAHRVIHGDPPALAYRIAIGDTSIVLAGDQNMAAPGFAAFARHADLMVAHAIGNEASENSSLKHEIATPSAIGRAARQAGVKRLVLSHWLEAPAAAPNANYWSLPDRDAVVAQIKRDYGGTVDVADDLAHYDVGEYIER